MNRLSRVGFYVYRFLSDFLPVYALYALFFQANGLSDTSISALFMVLAFTTLCLELPTGVLADRVDRRLLLSAAAASKAIGFLCWFLWPHPLGFGVGMVIWGFGISLESGCWQAFIYDELASHGEAEAFRGLFARLMGTSFIATLLSGIVGFILFATFHQYSVVLLFGIVAMLLAAGAPFFFPRAAKRENAAPSSLRDHLRETVHAWKQSPHARWLIVTAAFLGGVKGSLDEYHGLLLNEKFISIQNVPLFYAAFTLVGATVFFLVSRSKHKTEMTHLAWMMAFVGALILAVAWLPVWFAILALLIMNAVDSLARVENEALLQSSITPDATRATITSASSFSLQLVSLAAFGASALITRIASLSNLYLLAGITLMCVATYQWYGARKEKKRI